MLLPVSPDFMALCRLQISLLVQGFNVSQSTVYLAEDWHEGANTTLFPVIRYPESPNSSLLSRDANVSIPLIMPRFTDPTETLDTLESLESLVSRRNLLSGMQGSEQHPIPTNTAAYSANPQIVLPLVHEQLVLGLLAVERLAPAWTDWEQAQLEKIAHTLAISCLLDQQRQWLIQEQSRRAAPDDFLRSNQREMLDNLLHQLKSPITAIRTFGKLLLKRLKPQDENRAIADSVVHETEHIQDLLHQVQQVLQESDNESGMRLLSGSPPVLDANVDSALLPGESGSQWSSSLMPANALPLQLALEPCSITDILALPLASAAAIAQEHEQQLQVEVTQPLPPVLADPKALREVITNIVDNALKYTPNQGSISIRVFLDPEGQYAFQTGHPGIVIAVSDTGPGIPIADQQRLFERHYRGQQATGQIPGTGLGLAISRELMLKMQGNVSFWSPACPHLAVPSHQTETHPGSTFLIWVPLVEPAVVIS